MKKFLYIPIFLTVLNLPYTKAQEVDTNKVIPVLVPFNQVIFNDYCLKKAQQCERAEDAITYTLALSAVTSGMGACGAYSLTQKAISSWYTWMDVRGVEASLLQGTWATGTTLFAGFSTLGLISSIARLCAYWKQLFSNTYQEEYTQWNHLLCATRAEQENKWHETIYTLFGNPVVHGSADNNTSYRLEFVKKNGLGRVTLNPFDDDTVKIMLGIHTTIKDTCACDELYII